MSSMADNHYYKVVWGGFNNNVRDLLSDALHSGFHTDLTIMADNQPIRCHKMVLAKNIRFFRDLLSQDFIDDKHVIVAILAPYELVNAIVTFTYLGEITVARRDLNPLMKLATDLGVNGLIDNPLLNNSQESHFSTASSSVLCAAEALQTLGKAPRVADHIGYKFQQGFPIDYHVVPKQPGSHEVSNQPFTGEQPPTAQQDQVDFQSLRYKAAASRQSASRSPPPCSPEPGNKRRRLSQTTSLTSDTSPDERHHSTSTSGSYHHIAKQEEPDSEDSDGELQIDEGNEQESPMQYCDEEVDIEETPQDLRVEARQQDDHISDDNNTHSSSFPLQSRISSSESSISSSLYMPSSSVSVFPSTTTSDILYNSATDTTAHFLSSNLGEVTVHTVPRKRPNGIALTLNPSNNGNGNFVTLTHQLTNSRKTLSTSSTKDLVQLNINNNETNSTSNLNHNVSGNVKVLGGSGGSKSSERTYSIDQLTAAVEVVVKGQAQPVEAINQYSIPRRTFFRHLKNRRTELGIEPKNRSKPSSRATSPSSSGSPNSSSSSSGGGATPNLSNNFHQHHQIPASGTQLHAMLKSFSTAQQQKLSVPQSTNNNIVKQEPEDAGSSTNEEESSSSSDEKDKVFALLKKSVQMNIQQTTCSEATDN